MEDISKTGNHQLGKISVFSAKRKDTEKLIVQGFKNKKDSKSEANVTMTDGNDSDSSVFSFLSPLLFAI